MTGYTKDFITFPVAVDLPLSASLFPTLPVNDYVTAKIGGQISTTQMYVALDPARSYMWIVVGLIKYN